MTLDLLDFATQPAGFLVLLLAALLVLQSARLWIVRGAGARRMARNRNMGRAAERRARKILKKGGYRLLEEQVGGSYAMSIDGVRTPLHLRADYLVEKGGARYVAEVKAGAESAKITGRATRRQLLEYLLAFDVDGVLLVDMHEERIVAVSFPSFKSQ